MSAQQNERPELATWQGGRAPGERQAGHVGVVLPCYNEEGNVDELHERLTKAFAGLPQYTYELLFIDNASTDGTVARIRSMIARDPRVKLIVNARNFGHIRSPCHALLEADGDCVIAMSTDLQDPPELIPRFLECWRQGASVAVGQKRSSAEAPVFWLVRSLYYRIARSLADVPLIEHVTGFGLYDRRAIEIMRGYRDPYPYVRGLISDIGLPISIVTYDQPLRRRGITKNNFLTLFDMAMLGITSHSLAPLRLATLCGFTLAGLSLLVALLFLLLKLTFWYSLPAGYAPAVISILFLASVQIFLIGLVGEYVAAVLIQVRHRPLVVEARREPPRVPEDADDAAP